MYVLYRGIESTTHGKEENTGSHTLPGISISVLAAVQPIIDKHLRPFLRYPSPLQPMTVRRGGQKVGHKFGTHPPPTTKYLECLTTTSIVVLY